MGGHTVYALTRDRGAVVLMVRGVLDDATLGTFGGQLEEALGASGAGERVRVDLRGVHDVCGTAFMLLAIFGQRLAATGRFLEIVQDHEPAHSEDDEQG